MLHLLDLPDAALIAVVAAVGRGDASDPDDRRECRRVCRRMRDAVDASTNKVTTLDFWDNWTHMASAELADYLASLPGGCWAAVTHILEREVRPTVAAQLPRLCPRLRQASIGALWQRQHCEDDGGAAYLAAIKSCAPVAPTLEELYLRVAWSQLEDGDAARAGAALARLSGLWRLSLMWDGDGPEDAGLLLPAALPSLTALTYLHVSCLTDSPLLDLSSCPESLRELHIKGCVRPWALDVLDAAQRLAGVTKLKLCGALFNDGDDALALAGRTCPQLRELELDCFILADPGAALQHLTRLALDMCKPAEGGVFDLAAAAPRLEVLHVVSNRMLGADVLARHPKLREVRLEQDPCDGLEGWVRALSGLPQLASLSCHAGCAALATADWLHRCSRLTHLDLSGRCGRTLHDTLALVGATMRDGLRSLIIRDATLSIEPAEAARAFYVLPACFPSLVRLEVWLTQGCNTATAEVAQLALLRPLDGLLPACPELEALTLVLPSAWLGLARLQACCCWLGAAHRGKRVSVAILESECDS